jgi:hypothetical protein
MAAMPACRRPRCPHGSVADCRERPRRPVRPIAEPSYLVPSRRRHNLIASHVGAGCAAPPALHSGVESAFNPLGCTEQPHPASGVLGVNTPGQYLIAGDVENVESTGVLTAASPDLTRSAICVADNAQLAIDAPKQRPHRYRIVLGAHREHNKSIEMPLFR